MKKVLIDINVILDFLAKRENHQSAAKVFSLCENRKLKGYVSSHEITTLSYFLTNTYKSQKSPQIIINDLLDLFSTIPINETMLRKALLSGIDDYEDAVIEQAAIHAKAEYIVTSNIADSKKSFIKAITPAEFLAKEFPN